MANINIKEPNRKRLLGSRFFNSELIFTVANLLEKYVKGQVLTLTGILTSLSQNYKSSQHKVAVMRIV